MAFLWLPKVLTRFDFLKSLEDPGWKKKRVPGAYVAGDLTENRKTILLCTACRHGFDWKKYHYYSYAKLDNIYGTGRCDKCKIHTNRLSIYMPEEYLGQAGITRQETRRQSQRKAMIVG